MTETWVNGNLWIGLVEKEGSDRMMKMNLIWSELKGKVSDWNWKLGPKTTIRKQHSLQNLRFHHLF